MIENVAMNDECSNDDEVERSERHQKLQIVFDRRRKRFDQKHALNVLHLMKSDHLNQKLTSIIIINVLLSFVENNLSEMIECNDDNNIH